MLFFIQKMPSCVVKWCRSHSDMRKTGLTFHKFPTNEIQRKKWISAVRLERNQRNWIPSKSSSICSIHFQSEDMYKIDNGNLMRLRKYALPICTMVNKSYANVDPSGALPGTSSFNTNSQFPNDMENMDNEAMGSVSQARMKPGRMPTKTTKPPVISMKRNIMIRKECKKNTSKVAEQSSCDDKTSSSSEEDVKVKEEPVEVEDNLEYYIECQSLHRRGDKSETKVNEDPLKIFENDETLGIKVESQVYPEEDEHTRDGFKCSVCDQFFKIKKHLECHIITCAVTYSCKICDEQFNDLSVLRTHILRHIGSTAHTSCDICCEA